MIRTVLVLPSPPALLAPRSAHDPVADLREASAAAVSGLPDGHPVVVLAPPLTPGDASRGVTEPLGHRLAAHLLGDRGFEARLAVPGAAAALLELPTRTTLVVMADGSARRHEKAPGHLHPGAVTFDEQVGAALRAGDAEALSALDPEVGEELWCAGVPGLRVVGEMARGRRVVAEVSYAEAPYGVSWWVARWDLT